MRAVLGGELGLARLGDIPGLTLTRAAVILAEAGGPRRYETSKSLVKHVGLSPADTSSGASGAPPAYPAGAGRDCGPRPGGRLPRCCLRGSAPRVAPVLHAADLFMIVRILRVIAVQNSHNHGGRVAASRTSRHCPYIVDRSAREDLKKDNFVWRNSSRVTRMRARQATTGCVGRLGFSGEISLCGRCATGAWTSATSLESPGF